jgi:hypothetical protein
MGRVVGVADRHKAGFSAAWCGFVVYLWTLRESEPYFFGVGSVQTSAGDLSVWLVEIEANT